MKFSNKFQVIGAKGFKGTVEGNQYDSTTLYVVMDVSEKNGTEVGYDVQRMKFGKEEEFQKIKSIQFPVMAELEIELTTKGPEVLSFRPIQAQSGKAQASGA